MSLNHMIHNILFIKILGPDKLGQSRYCISPKRWYFIYKSCLPWRLFWRKRPKDLFIHINFQRMVSLITLEFVYHLAYKTYSRWYMNQGILRPMESSILNAQNIVRILLKMVNATRNVIYLLVLMMIAIVMVLITVLPMHIKIPKNYFINQLILPIFYSKINWILIIHGENGFHIIPLCFRKA